MNQPGPHATCLQCGTPLDSAAMGGLCPRCVALDFLAPAPGGSAEAEIEPLDNERLLGDYELLEEIARGGMGIVYRARQVSLGRVVAIKMILHGVLAGDTMIARFKAEAAAAAALSHPNIVAIHEIGEHRGRHFFSMEFVAGRTLADLLRDGPMSARAAAGVLERVAAAVHYAHERGVLHRDLKPSNILIDGQGQPRVTDFGLAKRFDGETDLTLTGQVLGTPAYISPEQAGGAKFGVVGARSDVYSLGALLYHAVCGLAPFSGETVSEILHKVTGLEPVAPRLLNPGLPRDLETICLKCLAKEPSRRYANALEMAEDLGRFLRGETILARPAGRAEKLWRWSRRQPALASALAACAVILVGGVSGILWQLRQTKSAEAIAVQKAIDEQTQRKAAERSELVMRQNLYTADMLAVQRALALHDLASARMLLNAHRPSPEQSDLRGFEWRYLWERAQGDKCIVLTNGFGRSPAIAFSPDGKWLASAGSEVILYDTESWQARARVPERADSLAFAPDSSSLVLTSWTPPMVQRWDWRQTNGPTNLLDPQGPWPRVQISPAGDVLAVGCGNDGNGSDPEGTSALYDLATGRARKTLPESGGVTAFAPDGKLLATGSWQGKIKLWNPATGELVQVLTNAERAIAMRFSPDGATLAVCAPMTAPGLWIYDVATGAQRPFGRGNFCCIWDAAISPDVATLATAVTDETVRLWDLKTGEQTTSFLGHSFQVAYVAWSPDGQVLASSGSDGTVRVWNIATAKGQEESVAGEVKPGLISSNGRMAALAEPDEAVSICELPSLRSLGPPVQIGKPLGFLPDGMGFASIRWPATAEAAEVVVSSVPALQLSQKIGIPCAGGPTSRQALSPDGRLLATSGAQGEALVWDLAGHGKLLAKTFVAGNGYADSLVFSPDSRTLAVGFLRSAAGYLWDLKPEHPPRAIPGMAGRIFQFSKDGGTLFANGTNGLCLWDAATGHERAHLLGRWGGVMAMDVSPDGKTLAFPTKGAVRLWNLATYREVGRLEIPFQSDRLAFAADGSALFIMEERSNAPVTVVVRAPGFEQTDAIP